MAMTPSQRAGRTWPKVALVTGAVVLVLASAIAVTLLLVPIGIVRPDPAATRLLDRAGALAAIAEVQAAEVADSTIREDCGTRLLDQGPDAEVVVLLHGYTNCPKQFDVFAALLAQRGYTVLIPRAPYHGEDPDLRRPLGLLTADAIAQYADATMDIAAGLGPRVSVLGLSGGGLEASYIAQFRPEADLVVPIAAFLGLPSVPQPLTPAVVNGIGLLPTIDAREAPPDATVRGDYPHGASDTSAQGATAYMRVADTVLRAAAADPPAAGRVVMVVNDGDDVVNNDMVEELARRWAALAPDRTAIRHLDASLGLLHDLVTPDREGARPDVAYPILLELLGAL
jgi:carboxylesterase